MKAVGRKETREDGAMADSGKKKDNPEEEGTNQDVS